MYSTRVDEKGRLKVPADFQKYFDALPEKKLFCTSVNRTTAQVYTLSQWRRNEELLASYEDADLANAMAFNANDLGSEATMDGQGRILLSPDLRRELEIENQPVKMYLHRGHIEVMSEPECDKRKQEARSNSAAAQKKLESAGLK